MKFLGRIVQNNTIRPSPAKTLAVKKFPMLPNVKHVQSFLGLTACFRKIIPSYAKIAKPLSNLLWENNLFTFGHEQQEVFEKLVR